MDCLTEEDLNLLTLTTPGTTKSWRKRGLGPSYVMAGNRVLYPRQAVAEFLKARMRDRAPIAVAGLL